MTTFSRHYLALHLKLLHKFHWLAIQKPRPRTSALVKAHTYRNSKNLLLYRNLQTNSVNYLPIWFKDSVFLSSSISNSYKGFNFQEDNYWSFLWETCMKGSRLQPYQDMSVTMLLYISLANNYRGWSTSASTCKNSLLHFISLLHGYL